MGRSAKTTILPMFCSCRNNFVEGYGRHDAIEFLRSGVLGSPLLSHEQNTMGPWASPSLQEFSNDF